MQEFTKSQTLQNLMNAYAGEAQAHCRYLFLAECARLAGYKVMGDMLTKIAKEELAHAKIYYDLIVEKAKDHAQCLQNLPVEAGYPIDHGKLNDLLKAAAQHEADENAKIYPSFAKAAEKEGYAQIASKFQMIAQIEACHHGMVQQFYDKLQSDTLYKSPTPIKWKCAQCGYEQTIASAWLVCPACGKEQGFVQIPVDVGK